MKVIGWNIHQGGGSRTSSILEAIASVDADVIILSEFNEEHSDQLMSSLRDRNWRYQRSSFSRASEAGIAVASRVEIESGELEECPQEGRWLHVNIPSREIEVCAAYAPLANGIKGEYWDWLIDAVEPLLDRKSLLIGDFNNGIYPIDHPDDARSLPKWKKMQELINSGWTDLYRHLHPAGRDSSWWTPDGAGFRIDHAFGSPSLRDDVTLVNYVTSLEGTTRPLVDTTGPSAGWIGRASSDHALLEVVVNDKDTLES